MKPVIFVDLDRTVFNTGLFFEKAWQVLGQKFNFDGLAAWDERNAFYYQVPPAPHKPVGYPYGFSRQIHMYIPGLKQAEAFKIIADALMGQDFLYDDSLQILKWRQTYEVRILTFGEVNVQKFKLGFCPALKDIAVDITYGSKADFITKNYKTRGGYLIDDKITTGLPKSFGFIHLKRGQGDYPRAPHPQTALAANKRLTLPERQMLGAGVRGGNSRDQEVSYIKKDGIITANSLKQVTKLI